MLLTGRLLPSVLPRARSEPKQSGCALVKAKVEELARLNPTRTEWLERFQELIEEYNAGSVNVETFFDQLVAFTRGLEAEEQRSLAEGLTDEQLAIFDLLTRPGPDLTEAEKKQVKRV